MDYMSTKQAALRWGISQNRITILANNGRIPGAVLIGKSWMIPSDAKKPSDARVHMTEEKQKKLYRFPLAFSDNYIGQPLYEVWKLHEKGQFEEAKAILTRMSRSKCDKYTRIGVLYFTLENAVYLEEYDRCSQASVALNILLAEEDEHKPELDIIRRELNMDHGEECPIPYDPGYPYSEDCRMYLSVIQLSDTCIRGYRAQTPVDTVIAEQYALGLEKSGYAFYASGIYVYAAISYHIKGDKASTLYYLRKVIAMAVKHDCYASLARVSRFFDTDFQEALSEFPQEVQDKFNELSTVLFSRYAAFLIYSGKNKLYSVLTEQDFRYIGYAMRRLTIREIALKENKSEKTINKRMSELYEKVGVGGKTELAKLYATAIADMNITPDE